MSLTAPPSVGVDGDLIDEALAVALLPNGRLRAQLDAMSDVAGTTWLIDPLLLESINALVAGAGVRTTDGVRASTDDESAAAEQWLADLRLLAQSAPVFAMPPADLDVRGALKFDHRTIVRSALTNAGARVDAVLGTSGITTAVQLYAGNLNDQEWAFLRDLGVSAFFVSDVAYRPTQQRYTPSAAVNIPQLGPTPVLVVDQNAASALASKRSESLQRQELAAQLAMTYLEQPNRARTIAIALPPVWSANAAEETADILNARWLRQTDVFTAALADAEPRDVESPATTRRQRQQEQVLRTALARQRTLGQLTSDVQFTNTINNAVGAFMSRWFTSNRVTDDYAPRVLDQLTGYVESVRVVTRGDIVFGGESGVVPVTVANGLPVPITVVLGASGLPSVRVEPTASTPLELNAGKRVSVELPTRVIGSGLAYLQLWLETADGKMIGEAVILNIRSAAYARVASYLVAAAFVTLLLLIGVNTVRRIRTARREA